MLRGLRRGPVRPHKPVPRSRARPGGRHLWWVLCMLCCAVLGLACCAVGAVPCVHVVLASSGCCAAASSSQPFLPCPPALIPFSAPTPPLAHLPAPPAALASPPPRCPAAQPPLGTGLRPRLRLRDSRSWCPRSARCCVTAACSSWTPWSLCLVGAAMYWVWVLGWGCGRGCWPPREAGGADNVAFRRLEHSPQGAAGEAAQC